MTFSAGKSNIESRENKIVFPALFFKIGGEKMSRYSYITFEQRKEIQKLYEEGKNKIDIASIMGRSVSAIYEELKRGYTGDLYEDKRRTYDADLAQTVFQQNIQRRGQKNINKKENMKND